MDSASLVGTLPGIAPNAAQPAPAASVSPASSASPAVPASSPASIASTSSSGSTALFIADIPLEVTEAEFRSTFSAETGYISARLRRDRNENTVGFVEFTDHSSAAAAREQFNNFKFSPNDERGITIYFAHEHSRNKHRDSRDRDYYGSGEHQGRKNYNNGTAGGSGGYRTHDGYSVRGGDVNGRVGLSHTPGLPLVPMGVSSMLPATGLALHGADMTGLQFYSPVAPNTPYASYVPQPQYSPQLPPDAASTLYVEGLPLDATEREVAHIFRQMPGYMGVRIKPKESKQHPSRVFNLCWVEFDNNYHATVALHHLKGYKMDKNDTKGLTISYAKASPRKGGDRSARAAGGGGSEK